MGLGWEMLSSTLHRAMGIVARYGAAVAPAPVVVRAATITVPSGNTQGRVSGSTSSTVSITGTSLSRATGRDARTVFLTRICGTQQGVDFRTTNGPQRNAAKH